VQVSALAAAVTIAVQLELTHWFYLYIVWFFPLVMVTVLGVQTRREEAAALAGEREEKVRPIREDLAAAA
jgi:FtsH-binding integral membrane protein